MKKSTRIVKRLLALFLVVLMSIESFAAVVSDNDGSAFITKAEFDSLKNDFQSQIDQYNTSIDAKIDGAIASYLAGINVATERDLDSLLFRCNSMKNTVWTKNWKPPYTKIGDRHRILNSFQLLYECASYANDGSNLRAGPVYHATLGIFEGTLQTTVPTWVYYGSEDTYIVQPALNQTFNKWAIDVDNWWKIIPTAMCMSSAWTTTANLVWAIRGDNLGKSTFNISVSPGTFENANNVFGTKTYRASAQCKLGEYSSSGNLWTNLTYVYITSTEDSHLYGPPEVWTDSQYITLLAGNKVEGNVIAVKPDDWNTTHTSPMAIYDTDSKMGWITFDTGYNAAASAGPAGMNTIISTHADFVSNEHWLNGAPLISVYMKKWSELACADLILSRWSDTAGKEVTYYSGVPICNVGNSGTLQLPLRFTFDGIGAEFNFSIRDTAFSNSDSLDATSIQLYEDIDLTRPYAHPSTFTGTTYEKTLYFRVDKDKTYWIKIQPKNEINVGVNTVENTLKLTSD